MNAPSTSLPTPELKWTMNASGEWVEREYLRLREPNGNLIDRPVTNEKGRK